MYGQMLWKYATRITPAVCLSLLVVLLMFSFVVDPFGAVREGKGRHHGNLTIWQFLLRAHILMLHTLSLVFPIRAFLALGDVIKKTNETAAVSQDDKSLSSYERALLFVIIIPTYKEDVETLRNTLSVLAAHPLARRSYHVRHLPPVA
jgi:hypothetical protein